MAICFVYVKDLVVTARCWFPSVDSKVVVYYIVTVSIEASPMVL